MSVIPIWRYWIALHDSQVLLSQEVYEPNHFVPGAPQVYVARSAGIISNLNPVDGTTTGRYGTVGTIESASALTLDPAGLLYAAGATENHIVGIEPIIGVRTLDIDDAALNRPNGLALFGSDQLLVANGGSNSVLELIV